MSFSWGQGEAAPWTLTHGDMKDSSEWCRCRWESPEREAQDIPKPCGEGLAEARQRQRQGAQRLGVITRGRKLLPAMAVGRGEARRGDRSDRTEKECGHE